MCGIRKLKKCYLPERERSYEDFIHWFATNMSGSVATYLTLTDGDVGGLLKLAEEAQISVKQKKMIEDQKKRREKSG